jgi:hypothetical protein
MSPIIEGSRPRPYLNAGAPTNGTSGTLFGTAAVGALLVNTLTGKLYVNSGTVASPTWTLVGSQT